MAKWVGRKFLLHHDNVPGYTAILTKTKLTKWGISVLEHPPNTPDLMPCNFSLFPKLKAQLRGRRFCSIQAVQEEVTQILKSFPVSVFEDVMHELVIHWLKCSAVNRDYFEGDHVVQKRSNCRGFFLRK